MAPQIDDIDKSTIVSLCPFPISEHKPGMFPGFYHIPAVKQERDIEVLIIGPSFHIQAIAGTSRDGKPQSIKVTIDAKDIARSVVNDFIFGSQSYADGQHPGLFWVRGSFTKEVVKIKFKSEIGQAYEDQLNWYRAIVQLADDDWGQFKQHKFITDNQRHAARILGLKRDWLISIEDQVHEFDTINCPACASVINAKAVICPNCRVIIDKEKYKQFEIAKAQ